MTPSGNLDADSEPPIPRSHVYTLPVLSTSHWSYLLTTTIQHLNSNRQSYAALPSHSQCSCSSQEKPQTPKTDVSPSLENVELQATRWVRGCFPSSSQDSQSSLMRPKLRTAARQQARSKAFWPRMPTSLLFFLASSSGFVILVVLVYSASLNFSRCSFGPYLHIYL